MTATACSYIKRWSPPRRLTRLFSIFTVSVGICFWTYFLYCYTSNGASLSRLDGYTPRILSVNQQQQPFDYLAKTSETEIASTVTILTSMSKTFNMLQHDITEIESMFSGTNRDQIADVTVLLHIGHHKEIATVINQIDSILSQSLQAKQIWILYRRKSLKRRLQIKLLNTDSNQVQFRFIFANVNSVADNSILYARNVSWLSQYIDVPDTQFTWVMEPNIIPESNYLYYTYGLLHTDEYKNKLIGYDTSLLLSNNEHFCLHPNNMDRSQQVDMVHGSWLLETKWVSLLRQEFLGDATLDVPLAYFISSSLLYRAGINSIALPSRFKAMTPSYCSLVDTRKKLNSVLPTVINQQRINLLERNRVAVLLDDIQQAAELLQLVCKLFDQPNIQLHVILTNGYTESDFDYTFNDCPKRENVMIHDLSSAHNNGVHANIFDVTTVNFVAPITRLLAFIQAQVLIQIKNQHSHSFHAIQAIAKDQDVTTINLPWGQIEHVLWIADLSVEALQHWNKVKIDLAVITDRRPESLSRLLESTNNAYYLGDDQIELVVHMEQSADSVTHKIVQAFEWQHGNKKVRHRIRKGGLMPAIVESWYPSDNDNYGLLLEDDIELSPMFYAWSKYNILKYRYVPEEKEAYQHIYGVSLYSPRNLELLPEGRCPFNPEPVLENGGYSKRTPYATQIPCSWGAVYFPEHWREFHAYLTERIGKESYKGYYNITVPESRSEKWKKSWKKYFIELVYLRAYVMVYPNFEQFESFSTNHLEVGTHVKVNGGRTQSKVDQFLVPLMQCDTIMNQLPNGHLPAFDQMPVMDLWGRIRSLEELDRVGATWHRNVSVCERVTGKFNPADLLCPFPANVEMAERKFNETKTAKSL